MNTKTNRRFGFYLPLTILLATVACTLRTVAAFLGVDAYGYFKAEALNSVSAWILVSAILIMLTYPIAYAKRTEVLVRHTTPLTFIPSLLAGLVLIFFVGELGTMIYTTLFPVDRIIFLLLFVLGIFSALFFFSLAIVESGVSDKKASYGMVLVLMLGIYAASLYLNTDIPRNAPIELAEEMTLIALSLFFLYEIRISLDKQKQNLYVCFGFIAALLSAYTALPSLIYYIASGTILLSSLSVLLLILALLIFTVARLYLFNTMPNNEACAMVRTLALDANEREREVRELEALYAPPTPEIEAETATETETESTPEIASESASDAECNDTFNTEASSDANIAQESETTETLGEIAAEVQEDSSSAAAHSDDTDAQDEATTAGIPAKGGEEAQRQSESHAEGVDTPAAAPTCEDAAQASAPCPLEQSTPETIIESAAESENEALASIESNENNASAEHGAPIVEKGEENEKNTGH